MSWMIQTNVSSRLYQHNYWSRKRSANFKCLFNIEHGNSYSSIQFTLMFIIRTCAFRFILFLRICININNNCKTFSRINLSVYIQRAKNLFIHDVDDFSSTIKINSQNGLIADRWEHFLTNAQSLLFFNIAFPLFLHSGEVIAHRKMVERLSVLGRLVDPRNKSRERDWKS